jgi:protein-disulfide isomerase/rhodanese-related sulfurtransferase
MRKTALLALSLIGLWDSAYLWWAYTATSQPMVCLGGGCDAVRASPFAYPRGIPLPIFGVAMYVTLALLFVFAPLVGGRLAPRGRQAAAGISGLGFLFSLYLSGIEAFVLHAWCTWCVISALSVTLIFGLAAWDVMRPQPDPEPTVGRQLLQQNFTVCLAAVVIGVPGFVYVSHHQAPPPAPPTTNVALAERLVRPDSHVAGNPQAAVTVVEWGDFQCPACGMAEGVAREIRQKYASQVRFVFRQFPLERIHSHALKAAEASECAAEQGRFWEMVEKLYGGDRDLSDGALVRDARELGLDVGRYEGCLDSGATTARIHRDFEDGRALGVRATPTFFVGDQRFEGPLRMDQFEHLLERELGRAGPKVASTEPSPGEPKKVTQNPEPSLAQHQAGDPALSSGGLLGGGGLFSDFQNSATTCSEEEALKEQPTLIRTAEARRDFEKGAASLFVDVRPRTEFEAGRIRGAINLPVDEVEKHWERLPKDRNIILYESGRSPGDVCASGRTAGRTLLAHGFSRDKVKVYQDGLAGWEKAGLPVEH